MFYFKRLIRWYKVIVSYNHAALGYLFTKLSKIYFFSVVIKRDKESIEKFKKEGRLRDKNIGHAKFDKLITLRLLNFKLGSILIEEGGELSAEHFYLNRNLKDIKLILKIFKKNVKIDSNSLIFDPGCGTGKHLSYLVDRYNCHGIGIDAYKYAIKVAELINYDNRIDFYNKSSLENETIINIMPKKCNYIFINSWLGHVVHHKNFENMIRYLLKISEFILVIEPKYNKLDSYFPIENVIESIIIDENQYALIRGNLEY